MFRLSGKCVRHTKIVSSAVISDESTEKSRTEKVLGAVRELATEFDLPSPLWLEKTSGTSNGARARALPPTTFWKPCPLTIWKSKSSKNELRALRACGA